MHSSCSSAISNGYIIIVMVYIYVMMDVIAIHEDRMRVPSVIVCRIISIIPRRIIWPVIRTPECCVDNWLMNVNWFVDVILTVHIHVTDHLYLNSIV